MWLWHSEESLEELPTLESTYFPFTLIKKRQTLLIPAATTANRLHPSQIFSLRIEVGRKVERCWGCCAGGKWGGSHKRSWERGLAKEVAHKDWAFLQEETSVSLPDGTL